MDTPVTTLMIKNGTDNDSVLVYLTLGAPPSGQTNYNVTIADFPAFTQVSGNPYAGYMTLAGSYTFYAPPAGKYMSGNICFGCQPSCANATPKQFPYGTTLFEFTLNNSPNAEAIDISCVNGVNSMISVDVTGDGGTFQVNGYDAQFPIYNKGKGYDDNSGLIGVYPIGCTTCTEVVNPPCAYPASQRPQKNPICVLTRTQQGGTVQVTLTSYYPASDSPGT